MTFINTARLARYIFSFYTILSKLIDSFIQHFGLIENF